MNPEQLGQMINHFFSDRSRSAHETCLALMALREQLDEYIAVLDEQMSRELREENEDRLFWLDEGREEI